MSISYRRQVRERGAPGIIGGLGILLVAAGLVYVSGYWPVEGGGLAFVVIVALVCTSGAALVYASVRISRTHVDRTAQWWASLWTLIGFGGVVAITTLGHSWRALQQPLEIPIILGELLLAGATGAIAGLLIGLATVDAMESTDIVEQQRDSIVFINRLLRHNVRNGMQIIQSYADLIETETDDEVVVSHAKRVRRRAQRLNSVVDDAQYLADSFSKNGRRRPVNLSRILAGTVVDAREEYSDSVFRTDIEGGLRVRGDDLVSIIFENLLSNAVDHHDGTPTVEVTARRESHDVVVEVRDDGPGIPGEIRERCFEPGVRDGEGSGEGFGLYLVKTLVDRYDADISIDATDGGTMVRVRFDALG